MFGILVLLVITFVVYNYSKNRRLYQARDTFPGPKVLPILGNSLEFASGSNGIFKKFTEFSRTYERFFRLWNNGQLFVVIHQHKDAEVLLSSNKILQKTNLYKFMKPWIGNGLVSTSDIDLWRRHRKIITPTFHFKILHDFLDVFNKNAEIFCDRLNSKAGKGPFDASEVVKLAFLDDICETAMGVSVNAQNNSDSDYVRAIKELTEVISLRFYQVWLMKDFIFYLSKYGKIQKKCLEILHNTTRRVIAERHKNFDKNEPDPDSRDVYGRKKLAFLDLLMKSEEGSKLTDQELREEVDTFMFAGHDTISSTVSFTLYALAQHPEIQEKAYKEQCDVFGDSNKQPTYSNLQEMKYLERVIKEVLRVYPSVPLIGRELFEDLILPDNVVVPKGAQIILDIYTLHRDPKVWPEPEKFNPDNFLPEATQSRNPYAYVPFSAGARNCVGQKYAMLAMKATLSSIIRRCKILPSPYREHELDLAAEIVLVSKSGHHIQVEPR